MSEEIQLNNPETVVLPNLAIPDPPATLGYEHFEDYRQREILKANGISLDEDELLRAAETRKSILQAAAVHTLGNLGVKRAEPLLKKLLTGLDDFVRVEAAYALYRLGVPDGKEDLIRCLEYPLEAYLCPPLAAGYLARSGDPRGYSVIQAALQIDFEANKMSACKQLLFFLPFDGRSGPGRKPYDIKALFRQALQDSSTGIQWQALVQLREAATPAYRPLLEEYIRDSVDDALSREARDILSGLGK